MVLFISRSRKNAVAAANLFKKLQIVAYGTTPREALSEISPLYHATVLMDPEEFPDYIDFIDKIHSYDSSMPVFALTDHRELLPHPELFAGIESNDVRSATFACKILNYAEKHDKALIGVYRAGGLEAICDTPYMTYYGIRLDFTKTEALIIRYLMATNPIPKNAAAILKYAFPPAKRPELATVRTHISSINKRFKKMFPCIDFIIHIPKEGYKIKTAR